jgi:hypothetical protein
MKNRPYQRMGFNAFHKIEDLLSSGKQTRFFTTTHFSRKLTFRHCAFLLTGLLVVHLSFGQCTAPPAQGTCTGGNGAATNGQNINAGQTYYFTGGPTTFASGVSLNGGTLRVCGTLILSTISFNSGTIIVTSTGSLTINGAGTLLLNGNSSIYNFGTLTMNRSFSMQNANNLFMNAASGALLNMNSGLYTFEINSGTSSFINYGGANIYNLLVQGNAAAGSVCLGLNSSLNLTNLTNNAVNSFNAPGGKACMGFSGNALLNANLSSNSNVKVCRKAGATTSGGASFGSAPVTSNCTSCSQPLPVSLTKFTAGVRDYKVLLSWTTAQEMNNDYFAIERSNDGVNWKELKRIKGSAYSFSSLDYQYQDEQPYEGSNYYRLRQVDMGGTFVYSTIVTVNYVYPKTLAVFPNPNTSSIIELRGLDRSNNYVLHLIDFKGKEVFTTAVTSDKIQLPKLMKGMYVMKVQNTATGSCYFEKYVSMQE